MEKISDTITTVFHIAIKGGRPAVCSSGDRTIVWTDTFGLGWRFGISHNPNGWFSKVHLHLDHNQTHTEQDKAIVSVTLRDSADEDAKETKERVTTIMDFGRGQPALLGSWSPSDLALHPYVSLTLKTKAQLPRLEAQPLSSASLALRHSMDSGDFVDTKFYVFSAKRPGTAAGRPRVVYANNRSVGILLPNSTSRAKQANSTFLVKMTSDHHINEDSMLHDYEYELDSDLDDETEEEVDTSDVDQQSVVPGKFQTGASPKARTSKRVSTDDGEFPPPTYSASTCRMILVRGVAYKTWHSYIYFRYTGQVSFRPLKSAQGSSTRLPDNSSQPRCSPKSMYRLAARLGDERMKEFALRAIKEGLSKDNIVEEAFSWFTAQYPIISEHEVDKVLELRKSPEVTSALKREVKVVSLGEKPWASDVLFAIMEKLNPFEPST